MAGYKPRVISLTKRPGQMLGFYLRIEHGEEGHLIRCLELGGPAELAGMKDGDRLLRVNGTFVDDLPHSEVTEIVRNSGSSVTFHILDAASYKQAKAQGVNMSSSHGALVANGVPNHAPKPKLCYLVKSGPSLGFSLKSIRGEDGFFITEVTPGGISHEAGIRLNDRLVEINGENVEALSHTQVVQKIHEAGSSIMFLLVDREAKEYYKRKNTRITASLATVNYLSHKPRIAEMTKGSRGYGFILKNDFVDKGHYIRDIDRGSPAERVGLRDMDRLIAVNGKEVDSCSHEQVVDRIIQCGSSCTLLVVDRVTDQMYKLGKVSPMLFLENMKDSNSPPSYGDVVTLPIDTRSSTPELGRREDLKPKLCRMEKTSAGYGFHLNGIEGLQGHYISEVVRGGAADRAGLEDDDIVIQVNGENVEMCSHSEVVAMISNSGSSLELLVASRHVYDQLRGDAVSITRHPLKEPVYAQVSPRSMRDSPKSMRDSPKSMREERHETPEQQNSRPETPSEGRGRSSSSSSSSSSASADSVDERF